MRRTASNPLGSPRKTICCQLRANAIRDRTLEREIFAMCSILSPRLQTLPSQNVAVPWEGRACRHAIPGLIFVAHPSGQEATGLVHKVFCVHEGRGGRHLRQELPAAKRTSRTCRERQHAVPREPQMGLFANSVPKTPQRDRYRGGRTEAPLCDDALWRSNLF